MLRHKLLRKGIAEYMPIIVGLIILASLLTYFVLTTEAYRSEIERLSKLMELSALDKIYTKAEYVVPPVVAWTDGVNTYVYNNLNTPVTIIYDSSSTTVPPNGDTVLPGPYETITVVIDSQQESVVVLDNTTARSYVRVCSQIYTEVVAIVDPVTNFVMHVGETVPPHGCLEVAVDRLLQKVAVVTNYGNIIWAKTTT